MFFIVGEPELERAAWTLAYPSSPGGSMKWLKRTPVFVGQETVTGDGCDFRRFVHGNCRQKPHSAAAKRGEDPGLTLPHEVWVGDLTKRRNIRALVVEVSREVDSQVLLR